MDVLLKVAIQLPIFSPLVNHTPTRERSSTELRFSRWNNANAEKFNQRRRTLHEIEDEICRTRRNIAADNIINTATTAAVSATSETFKSLGTPSAPSQPSIPGKKSKYSKPPPKPKSLLDWHPVVSRVERLEFRPGPENVKIGEDGVSYIVEGAPFDFRFSYTETPKANPVKLREPPFAPFGPPTLPRPWTGRNPVPPSKTTVTEFHLLDPPLSDEEGAELVRLALPIWESRKKVLGEPLTKDEINRLVKRAEKYSRQLHIGRDGLTHNMLENIHTYWMRSSVCKIKCRGVCTVDMDNVCQQLEERTGGEIIYRHFGTVYLFRGRNYNYETRPRFPLMWWRPVSPVYPKLIKRVPEGLTLDEATEMRQKGRVLMPIRKLAKNGVYWDLVTNVREAFEQCDLVRINCQELNTSDYKKIGAKLKDLVPCVLLSFEDDHILMWRGPNWRPSLPNPRDDDTEATKVNVDNGNSSKLTPDARKLSAACLQKNRAEHLCNEPLDISILSNSHDLSLHKTVPCLTENSKLPVSDVSGAASLPMKTCEVEITEGVMAFSCTPQMVPGTNKSSASTVADPRSDKFLDGSEADVSEPSKCEPCTEGLLLLLDQAVEKGRALVLDDKFLDDDYIYQTSVAFSKSTPP
ncbi:RNA-binding [Vigna unguiculata]|uniref:RNA-binding n=1 Tax=Vigna unguiculata TaxID=3917 RepID=A0A4D6LF01_VIGUN|nr:RNA-binding [Vigna unguiculata]